MYTIATVATRGIGVFLIPIYTRYLSPSEYGIIDYFIILSSVVNLIITLEIFQAVARYYQDAIDIHEKRSYVSTAFTFTSFIYTLYLVISFIFSKELSFFIFDSENMSRLFTLASGTIATNGIFYFTQNQLKFAVNPKGFAIVSLINIIFLASIASYLLICVELKVESIFIAQIIANIVSLLIAVYISRENYGLIFIYKRFQEMITFSYPLVFSGIAVFVIVFMDRIAIKQLLGLHELGVYGVSYRFASIAGLVMVGFQSSLMPLVYKHYKEENTPYDIAKIFNIFNMFALIAVSFTIVFSKEIIVLFTTEVFYGASELIAILTIAIFFSNMYIFAPGIAIAKKTKLMAVINFFGAGLNIALNYTMIPLFGVIGAGFATLISAILVFIIYIKVSYKYYPVPYMVKKPLWSFLFICLSGYMINDLFDSINYLSIFCKISYLVIVSLLVTYMLLEKQYYRKNYLKKFEVV